MALGVRLMDEFLRGGIFIIWRHRARHEEMKTDNQSKPCRLAIKRNDDTTYFITTTEEQRQFTSLLLGDVEPEQCKWTIQPAKLDWKAYRPEVMGAGSHLFIVTNHQEWQQVVEVAGGHLEVEKCVFTIPPYRWTAS